MGVVRVVKHETKYVIINKTALEDTRLSFKAKGLWAYCMGRPNDWEFKISHLKKVSKDGEDALYSAFKELIELGYCERVQPNPGKFQSTDYLIYEEPINKCLPHRDFPDAGKSLAENPALLRNDLKPRNEKERIVCYPDPVGSDSEEISSVEDKKPEILKCPQTIEKKTPEGQAVTCNLNDIFLKAIKSKFDWKTSEIQEAWKILVAHSGFIRDPFAFIKGTITNLRTEKKSQYLKKQGKLCTNDQIMKYAESNEKLSAKDTKEPVSLGQLLEDAGMMPKGSIMGKKS